MRRLLLRKGGFPPDVRARLEQERPVLLAEGVAGRLTPQGGRAANVIGALALTQQALAVYAMGERLIDVTWDGGEARDLDLAAEDRRLRIGFDAGRFSAARTGRQELELHVGDAAGVLAAIEQRRRELPPRRRFAGRD